MPTLVLLPGLHGTADLFGPLLREIPGHFSTRVIEYPVDRVCDGEGMLTVVEEAVGGVGEMVLVAESFSGPVALAFAAKHAGRVKGVVLCVSFVLPPVPRVLCYLATPLIWLRMPVFDWAVRVFLSGFRATGEVVRATQREIRRVRLQVLAHRVRQAAWVDARGALRACTMPVLCLAGKRDRLVGRRSVRRMRRVRAEVTIKWIDGPHLLLQVKPIEAWAEIAAFLKALD